MDRNSSLLPNRSTLGHFHSNSQSARLHCVIPGVVDRSAAIDRTRVAGGRLFWMTSFLESASGTTVIDRQNGPLGPVMSC